MTLPIRKLIPLMRAADTPTLLVSASDAGDRSRADFVCDGVDDNIEIQAAIDTLPTGGGKIVLSEGTFTIAATIVPTNNLVLEGMGESTTIIAANNLDDNIIGTLAAGNLSNARFRSFRIDGNRNNNASGSGFFLFGARFCTIEYVTIETCDDHGIHFQGPAAPNQGFYNWIKHNHVFLCDGDGIRIEGTEFSDIVSNIVRFIGGDGIFAEVTNDKIHRNTLDSITGHSIHVQFGAGRWTITNNDIDRPLSDAIVMRRNNFGIVNHNRIGNLLTNMTAIKNGEFVDNDNDPCDNINISDNIVEIADGATGTIGIEETNTIGGVDRAVYTGNQVSSCATPIQLDGNSTNGISVNNQV